MKKIKIGIAEDNKVSRKAIAKLIQTEDDLEVILQAEDGKQLLELLKTITPDIILMDIRMPEMDGIEASEKVKELYPSIKIIAFSLYDLEDLIIEMNIRGVKSFIGKEDDPEELFKAIRIVKDGGVYMTDRSAEIVQRYLSHISKYLKDQPDSICEHEKILIKMIIEGLTSRQIGEKMGKSHRTIDDMRERLYLKFNVKSKTQLIALASKWNFI
jgi:DNA-binding NarL/FixJ family response regulator